MQTIGLDHWLRFLADAQARAGDFVASGPAAVAPVPFTDDMGQVMVNYRGETIRRPAGMDPHVFVSQGLQDKKTEEALIASGNEGSGPAALGYQAGVLRKFERGGPWDAQRIGASYHPEFVDYATAAIGLYAAANGMSRDEILRIQDAVARNGHCPSDTGMDKTYTHLPTRNIYNTDLGYWLYQSGRIGAAPRP